MKRWIWIALAWTLVSAHAAAQDPVTEPCLVTQITAERGVAKGGFGAFLAAQSDELFVGSIKSETTLAHPGSIHAMRRDGLHWYREAEIVAPDEVVRFFGMGLTVKGDTLVAGGFRRSGDIGVYVYRRSGEDWVLASTLDPLPAHNPYFYPSVHWAAIDGEWIAIGASNDATGAAGGGAVRVYRESGDTWQLHETLLAYDGRMNTRFGFALDLERGRLAVGAPGFSTFNGTTYVYELVSDTWELTADVHVAGSQRFGYGVSVDGDRLAALDRGFDASGCAAYVFEYEGGAWRQVAKLLPEADNLFEERIELLGDRLFVGGPLSGYLFQETGSVWQREALLEARNGGADRRMTMPAVTRDFVYLGLSCRASDWDWVGASDQRAVNGGAVLAYSIAESPCASLSVTRRPISFGKHELTLSRGPASAGHAYCLIGSMSGTSPGTRIRGRRVPLNPDAYFRWTAFAPNRGAFTSNFGRLDENGEATVRLDVPPEAVALFQGRNVDHAFLEFAQGELVYVSNVAQVRFSDRLR